MDQMQPKLQIFYDPEEDCYGYQMKLTDFDKSPDNLYRILGEILCELDEIYGQLKENSK